MKLFIISINQKIFNKNQEKQQILLKNGDFWLIFAKFHLFSFLKTSSHKMIT